MSEGITPLGDLSPQIFLADYWQQQPLVVRQAFPGFQSPISAEQLAGLSCESDVNSRIVIEKGGQHPWQTFFGPMDEAIFAGLPETHWSLLVNDVEKHLPQLAWILDCFRFIPEWCVDDLMISYAPAGGSVGPHLDRYDVFILQAQGHRHWQIHQREVAPDNRVAGTDMDIQQDFEADQDWLLAPGDLIYLPPGVSHYGVATDDCMSFSIGFRAPSHADMLQDFAGFISEGRAAEVNFTDPQLALQQHANELMPTALNAVSDVLGHYFRTDHPAVARWFGRFISDVKTDVIPELEQPLDDFAVLVARCRVLQRHPASHFAFYRQQRDAMLFVDGEDYQVSIEFAEQLCAHRSVDMQVLADTTTTAEQQQVLQWFNSGKLWCPQ